MAEPIIEKATIIPAKSFGERTIINAQFTNGNTEDLIQFFHDELTFTTQEVEGLTRQEALDLWHKKDVAYLQS